jgi:hypothetical protein
MIHKKQSTRYKIKITISKLNLQVTIHKKQSTSYNLQVSIYKLQFTSYNLQIILIYPNLT